MSTIAQLHWHWRCGSEGDRSTNYLISALLYTLETGACIRASPQWVFQGSDEGHLKEAGGAPTRCLEETNDVA